jgi:hypothetical protein
MKREGLIIAGAGVAITAVGVALWRRAQRKVDECVATIEPGSGKICDLHEEAMSAYVTLGIGITGLITGGALALITD